jgi:hypothetical protein
VYEHTIVGELADRPISRMPIIRTAVAITVANALAVIPMMLSFLD